MSVAPIRVAANTPPTATTLISTIMKKSKPFIARADVLRVIMQFCSLNDIDLKKNPDAIPIALNAFWHGVQTGRNGNKTFQDPQDDDD